MTASDCGLSLQEASFTKYFHTDLNANQKLLREIN